MKEKIGKKNCTKTLYQNTYFLIKVNIFDQKFVHFDRSFNGVGPQPAEKILDSSVSFENYLNSSNTFLKDEHLSTDELRSTFFSLPKNKSAF